MGYAQAKAGEPWRALEAYERALKLSKEPFYWISIGWIFLELGLTVHAIHAYRQVERAGLDDPPAKEARERLPTLEAKPASFAHDLFSSETARGGRSHVPAGCRSGSMPRTNLATFRLDEGDVEGAKAILAPLGQATRFTAEEVALYASSQTRVFLADQDFDAARESLKTAVFAQITSRRLKS